MGINEITNSEDVGQKERSTPSLRVNVNICRFPVNLALDWLVLDLLSFLWDSFSSSPPIIGVYQASVLGAPFFSIATTPLEISLAWTLLLNSRLLYSITYLHSIWKRGT